MSSSGFPYEVARAHVEYLAATHGITVYEIQRQWDAEADIKMRTVFIADPKTPMRYMLALHEIGHIVDKVARMLHEGKGRHDPGNEAAAWSWAYDNADPNLLEYLTPRHWTRIGRAWATSLGKHARSASPYH